MTIDWATLCEPIARIVWGNPSQENGAELRWGTRGSRCLDRGKGTWFDHEANEGGGALDLVPGADTAARMRWLADHKLIDATPRANGKVNGGGKRKIVAAYDYTDEAGVRLYQVCRFDPRGFSQRRPDGKGGWTWKLGDVRRVLYRLPELLAAIARGGETVHIVEGEKDVHSLAGQGLIATTNPGGAGKWRREYSETFRNTDVIIIADNDDAGRAHVASVAASLNGIAARVRILDLAQHWPECPVKGDVSDWLSAGHTADELKTLVEALPDWQPSEAGVVEIDGGNAWVDYSDFYAHMPSGQFIFVPARELWPATSVDARLPPMAVFCAETGKEDRIKASRWIASNRPVEQITWWPGKPMLMEDSLVCEGGLVEKRGCQVFNFYQPPPILPGDPNQAGPWLDHVRKLYPDPAESEHLLRYFAHRVQRPHEKINHGIVMGGGFGIGKDTVLNPVKEAIGPWNWQEVSPSQLLGRFNGFCKAVMLRISEARDLGDVDRYALYEHSKVYLASPSETLRVDEKFLREYSVPNIMGVVFTTNHRTDGLYIPPDDRRHFVVWSELTQYDFADDYFPNLYAWFDKGGKGHVAAHLRTLDLSNFDAKAPPPKTKAFWAVVDAGRAPEDAELADVLDALGWPDVVTIDDVASYAPSVFVEWLRDRKNARRVPHRFEAAGYLAVRNDGAKDGAWKVGDRRQVIYGKAALTLCDRLDAAIRRAGAR